MTASAATIAYATSQKSSQVGKTSDQVGKTSGKNNLLECLSRHGYIGGQIADITRFGGQFLFRDTPIFRLDVPANPVKVATVFAKTIAKSAEIAKQPESKLNFKAIKHNIRVVGTDLLHRAKTEEDKAEVRHQLHQAMDMVIALEPSKGKKVVKYIQEEAVPSLWNHFCSLFVCETGPKAALKKIDALLEKFQDTPDTKDYRKLLDMKSELLAQIDQEQRDIPDIQNEVKKLEKEIQEHNNDYIEASNEAYYLEELSIPTKPREITDNRRKAAHFRDEADAILKQLSKKEKSLAQANNVLNRIKSARPSQEKQLRKQAETVLTNKDLIEVRKLLGEKNSSSLLDRLELGISQPMINSIILVAKKTGILNGTKEFGQMVANLGAAILGRAPGAIGAVGGPLGAAATWAFLIKPDILWNVPKNIFSYISPISVEKGERYLEKHTTLRRTIKVAQFAIQIGASAYIMLS